MTIISVKIFFEYMELIALYDLRAAKSFLVWPV